MEKAPSNVELIKEYFDDFTPVQWQQLSALENLYGEWNQKINVISRKDIEGLYEKHVLHSLSIAAVFDLPPGSSIIDIGTGGGFPGIPLAIYFPETQFHLVDSIGKKLKVVQAIASELSLNNITTEHTRAEDIKNRKFDYAVSRAVAPLGELWRWAKPLLRPAKPDWMADNERIPRPGLVCLKGGDLVSEIQESGCRPHMIAIRELFDREYFDEKFLLYVPR